MVYLKILDIRTPQKTSKRQLEATNGNESETTATIRKLRPRRPLAHHLRDNTGK